MKYQYLILMLVALASLHAVNALPSGEYICQKCGDSNGPLSARNTDCDDSMDDQDPYWCDPATSQPYISTDVNKNFICDVCEPVQQTPNPTYMISKTVSPGTVASGGTVVYTISVGNTNAATSTVTLRDTLTGNPTFNAGPITLTYLSETKSIPSGVTVSGSWTSGYTITGLSSSTGPATFHATVRAVVTSGSNPSVSSVARLSTGQEAEATLVVQGQGTTTPTPTLPNGPYYCRKCGDSNGPLSARNTDCDDSMDDQDPYWCDPLLPASQINTDVNKNRICDVCEVQQCTPTTEVCDNKDNDCDGLVDENNVCSPTCTPTAEICDNKDNDCDGLVDENNVCVGAPEYAVEKNVVNRKSAYNNGEAVEYSIVVRNNNNDAGTLRLTDLFTDSPSSRIGSFNAYLYLEPSTVSINTPTGTTVTGSLATGGLTITNLKQSSGPVTVTYRARVDSTNLNGQYAVSNLARIFWGSTTRQSSTVVYLQRGNTCTPATEVCDNKDNDCDGQVDEGNVCSPTCTQTNNGVEICDNKDNNCNGYIDEGNVCGSTTQPVYSIRKQLMNGATELRDGDIATYKIEVYNANNALGTVRVTDSFTGALTIGNSGAYLTLQPDQQITGLSGSTTATGTIANGITITNLVQSTSPVIITYKAKVSTPNMFSPAALVTNTAMLNNGATARATANIVQTKTGAGGLALEKTVSNANPVQGEVITYTIRVRNTGTQPVTSAAVYDTIGDNLGTIPGNRGGSLVFQGTEQVSGIANGQTYTQSYSGSVASRQGLTLTNIPANGLVTISYQVKVNTEGIGTGVTSVILNSARTAGTTSAAVRVNIVGKDVPPTTPGINNAPYILPIPSQVQTCGAGFTPLALDQYVGDAESSNSALRYSVDGNRYLQASIDQSTRTLRVTDPTGVQNNLNEFLRITVQDPQGRTTTRTVTYSVLRNIFAQPVVTGVPDQIIRKGKDFDSFDLDKYTQIGGSSTANRTVDYYVTGSSLFDVTIGADNVVRIEYDEDLFRMADVDQISEELTFHVGSSRVDLQACKLEYSIVSPK